MLAATKSKCWWQFKYWFLTNRWNVLLTKFMEYVTNMSRVCHQNVVESILNLARSEIRGQDLKIVFSVIFTGGYTWFKYFNSFLTQSAAEPRKPSLWGRRRGKLDVQSEVLTVLKAISFPHIVYGILYTVNFEKHFSNGDSKLLWTRTFNNGHFIFTCNVR